MRHRLLLSFLVPALVLAAACGDDDTETGGTGSPSTTEPGTDAGDEGGGGASAASDVVLEIGYEGGFVPAEVAFVNTPQLLVTGDGRLVQGGVVPAIYPGPLLPAVVQRSISPDGVQALLDLADDRGLLADIEYARADNIADAPDTVVTVTVDGTTYEHRAYALGMGDPSGAGESDEARANLAEFVTEATALATGSDELGPEEPFVADSYLLRATEAGNAEGLELPPTVLDWPADAPVRLADATGCAEVPVAQFESLFLTADQNTWFTDGDVTYALAVTPQLPGRSC